MRAKRFQFNGEIGKSNDRSAILTQDQAQQILDSPTVSDAKKLAVEFGVSEATGYHIWKRKSWRHLKRTVTSESNQ